MQMKIGKDMNYQDQYIDIGVLQEPPCDRAGMSL